MPSQCAVYGCNSRTGGHRFPVDKGRRLKWIVACRRTKDCKKLWQPTKHDLICKRHFTDADYMESNGVSKKQLRPNAVPSIELPGSVQSSTPSKRAQRQAARDTCMISDSSETDTSNQHEDSGQAAPNTVSAGSDNQLGGHKDTPTCNSSFVNNMSNPKIADTWDKNTMTDPSIAMADKNVECRIDSGITSTSLSSRAPLSIFMFREDTKELKAKLHYLTSFNSFLHFMLLFNCLGEAANYLEPRIVSLHVLDQLFLTIMKLRLGCDDMLLSLEFSISETTVHKVFNQWLNFLYFQLSELNWWPSSDVIQQSIPVNFKNQFPTTKVILDATETPIVKPKNVKIQRATFSSYKNRNTLKTLIGCSPRGVCSYVSPSYGGATSDRQIVERSDLLADPTMLERGDSVMADRGIMVQDLFAAKGVQINTPTMLKGKSQLEPSEVIHDRRVASKRIHIERVIGLGKQMKILKQDLHQGKRDMGSRIIKVCYLLSNFRDSIVNKLA